MPVGCSGVHHLNLAGNLVILPATVYTMDGALVLGSQLLGACQVACAALGAVVQVLNGSRRCACQASVMQCATVAEVSFSMFVVAAMSGMVELGPLLPGVLPASATAWLDGHTGPLLHQLPPATNSL